MRVRSLNCPHCGGRTRLDQGQQEAACIQCGQPVRLSSAVLEEQAAARRFPPRTAIRLGMKATYRGKEFEVTGRQVLQSTSEGEVSTWEEWVLVAPDGDLLFLEFDEGKWKLSQSFVPRNPMGPEHLRAFTTAGLLAIDGHGVAVTDTGSYTVAMAEGEFPWMVFPHRAMHYLDAVNGRQFYCVEWTEDAVEYYRGQFLDARQVYSMFGLLDLVAALDRRVVAAHSRKAFGGVCLLAGLLAFLIMAFGSASGRPVPNGSGSIRLGSAGPDGVRFGPIQLTAVNRVHRLEIRGFMREESHWVAAVLEDPDERELISADRDMWDESGRDSDGPWHESDLAGSADFVLRKPGAYHVRMYAESDPGRVRSGNATATFTLREKVLHRTYLGILGGVLVVLGALLLISGASSTRPG